MPSPTNKIIYIAGYGRSGSTLLDMVLSLHQDTLGVGELTNLFFEAEQGRLTAPIWKNFVSDFSKAELGRRDALTKQIQFFPFFRSTEKLQNYLEVWTEAIGYGVEQSAAKILIDSSKTTKLSLWRPYLLRRAGYEVQIIHLIRDVRAVMFSEGTKGSNVALEHGGKAEKKGGEFRVLLSWIWTNFISALIYGFGPDYTLLRYEDFTKRPDSALYELNNCLKSPLSTPLPGLTKPVQIDNTGVSGNRLRRTTNVVIKFDEKWRKALPVFYRKIAILGFPLMLWFGYFRNEK